MVYYPSMAAYPNGQLVNSFFCFSKPWRKNECVKVWSARHIITPGDSDRGITPLSPTKLSVRARPTPKGRGSARIPSSALRDPRSQPTRVTCHPPGRPVMKRSRLQPLVQRLGTPRPKLTGPDHPTLDVAQAQQLSWGGPTWSDE